MTNLAPGAQTVAFPYLAHETSVLFATECVDTLLGTLVEQALIEPAQTVRECVGPPAGLGANSSTLTVRLGVELGSRETGLRPPAVSAAPRRFAGSRSMTERIRFLASSPTLDGMVSA